MTDADWFAADSPDPLIDWLRGQPPHPRVQRIVFLYASACYRLNWDAHDPAIRSVVEMLERKARRRADPVAARPFFDSILSLFSGDVAGAMAQVVSLSGSSIWVAAIMATQATRPLGATPAEQVSLLREFHPPPSLSNETESLSVNDERIQLLIRQIDERQHYHLMPVLGDLLNDTGQTDAVTIAHCRAATTHHPGCWALERLC